MERITKNRNYYITIADWMLDFKLPIMSLLCYAIVYSHCQTGGSNCYFGSTKTMAELLGINDKGNASKYLNDLVDRGLLEKEEVKCVGKQKMCKYYVTTDWAGRVEDQDVDYIVIQPWMFKKLGLRNSLLLIYARIQNISRTRSIYFYDDEDLARWCQCDKRRIRGFIKQLVNQGNISLSDKINEEGYVATIPEELKTPKNTTPIQKIQHPNLNTPKNTTQTPKNTTNNLLYNLYIDKLDIITDIQEIINNNSKYQLKTTLSSNYFDIEKMINSHSTKLQILRIIEAYKEDHNGKELINKILNLIIKTLDNWSVENINKVNDFSDEKYIKLFSAAQHLIDTDADTPEKLLSIKIRKLLHK